MEPGSTRRRAARALRVGLALGLLASLLAPSGSALAQGTLTISTPFPGISIQPGAPASIALTLTSSESRVVDLTLSGVPSDWTAALHGGGFTVNRVFLQAAGSASATPAPPDLKLDIRVPDNAQAGTTNITVKATSGGLSASVTVAVTVASTAGGTVAMTSDFPSLKGRADQSYTFNLNLQNNTPQALTFTLTASGPPGWTVDAKPATQAQAASFTVNAGESSGVTVTVTPATDAGSNTYPIDVQAVSGTFTADQKLSIEITGNVALDLGTVSGQPLSTTATAGSEQQYTLVVSNTGTSPATNITMASTPPSGWTVTFDTPTIQTLNASATQNVIATIKPAAEAIAGDYIVTFRASSAESDKSVDVRVTVQTSVIWGVIGVAIIVLVIAGLLFVFQRYGRR